MTFIDRRFKRHLPIQADYIGKTIDSLKNLQYSYEKIVAVLPTSEICTLPFDNTKLIKKIIDPRISLEDL